jgi:hypothetical protein
MLITYELYWGNKQNLFHAAFLLSLLFRPGNGDSMFLQNVRWLTKDCAGLCPRRQCFITTAVRASGATVPIWSLLLCYMCLTTINYQTWDTTHRKYSILIDWKGIREASLRFFSCHSKYWTELLYTNIVLH